MTKPSLLWIVTGLTALALLLHGPIAQWPDYHAFADQRAWRGLPHAADVLSNLPFLLIGLWGLSRPGPATWRLFAAALVCTAAGSAFYHLAPDNTRLVFDRLPIAWACALLACAFLAERVDARWGRLPALAASLLLASASVGLWWVGDAAGQGDLRAYLFVQFLPMLLVVAGLSLRLPPLRALAVPGPAWWVTLGCYAAAKAAELADHAVLQATGLVSGHTLKHLLAAAAAAWILRAALRSGSPR
ncbi:MAG: hypothetical protein KF788_03215 [Piscinibacter sp.]|nr:hypothetical protein [Piscinibacter sp.]